MKVLAVTKEMQGKRKNDFCFANEGELVFYGAECDGERVNGRCGCRRSLVGVETRKATTTFKVVERDLTIDELMGIFIGYFIRAGWRINPRLIQFDLVGLLDVAKSYGPLTVLEKRGKLIVNRKIGLGDLTFPGSM